MTQIQKKYYLFSFNVLISKETFLNRIEKNNSSWMKDKMKQKTIKEKSHFQAFEC